MSSTPGSGSTTAQGRYEQPRDLSKYAWLSIVAALATIAIKGAAAWLTGSVALLSDAAESLVNLAAAIVALIALKVSAMPPDENHQFGHSKAEYFSAVVEGALIFVAAGFIIVTAGERLFHPVMPEQIGVGLALSVGASLINGAVAYVLIRTGTQERSVTLIADGRHLLTDVITSAAVLLGVGLVALTNEPRLDAVVALLAGVIILWTGFRLIRQSVAGLMDVTAPDDVVAQIEAVLDRYRSDEIEFHAVRTRESGNRRFMSAHVLVPGDWSVREGHDFAEDVSDTLIGEVPGLRVTTHVEPKEDPRSYDDLDL